MTAIQRFKRKHIFLHGDAKGTPTVRWVCKIFNISELSVPEASFRGRDGIKYNIQQLGGKKNTNFEYCTYVL
jgi:hypothetical protein